jgi:hypothetical protein
MISNKLRRSLCLSALGLIYVIGGLQQSATALDTANSLYGIDAMVLRHNGLFRQGTPNDGNNTFEFGSFSLANPITAGYGRYSAVRWAKVGAGDCCISHNARIHSDTPDSAGAMWAASIHSGYAPTLDRVAFGALFDPAEYQIEVKFKPLLTQATANSLGVNPFPNQAYPPITSDLENTAPFFHVGLDRQAGFVWDAEASIYKRAGEGMNYNVGSEATPINQWYASAPKDADGFATFTVPVLEPSEVYRTFYYNYAQAGVPQDWTVSAGGRAQDDMGMWVDVNTGWDNYEMFGGGPSEPGNPGTKLNVPNGVPLMFMGAPNPQIGLSVELKYMALTRINPGRIAARIDGHSGISHRFGSGYTYGATQPPITVDGFDLQPAATNQISRFDQNGLTNMFINMRMPDNMSEEHRIIIRGAPGPNHFDGTNATVNIRARLLEPLTNPGMAPTVQIVAKDLDGNDLAASQGADEYRFLLELDQFNTSSMTTVSIPLEEFDRMTADDFLAETANSTPPRSAPIGFTNLGDDMLEDFALYEFGLRIPYTPEGEIVGLLRMELEFLELLVGLPGDFNEDGNVNAADFVVWRKNDVANSPLPNDNGLASQAERYELWRTNFGSPSAGSGSLAGTAAVPEPAAWLLAVFAAAFFGSMRPRGR